MRRVAFTILLALLSAATAYSEVTFPLGERYRVGKYLPVHVDGTTNRVELAGVVPVEVSNPGGTVVPLLVVGTLGTDRRPLADDERLIGATTPDAQLAAELFPQKRVEFATLNLADPLPGPALAWTTLDAVFLDAAAAARVTEPQLATLLASGTTVAVRTERQPAGNHPWQRHDEWWVARPESAFGGIIQPEQYQKFSNVGPGWPASVRRLIFLILCAFTVLALAVSLWRPRRAWLVVVLVSAAAVAAILVWRATQSGIVKNVSGNWTHYAAVADGELRHPIDARDAAVWPIFWSRRHAHDLQLHLQCEPDGTPIAFIAHLNRGQSLLFLDLTPAPAPATAPAAPSR